MRILFLITFFLLSSKYIYSQEIVVINDDNKPIEDVSLQYIQGNKIKNLVSNKKGLLSISSDNAHSFIFSHINYIKYNIDKISSDTVVKLKEKIFFLDQVVVTGQIFKRLKQKSQQNIYVIDKKMIEAKAANTLKEILSSQLGIRISQDNVLGSGVNINGISGRNIKVLIDGVPVIGRLDGNIDLSQITLNNIERIEIVKGPLSVDYGTDALGGTINLISSKGLDKRFLVHFNSYYETVGRYNADIALGIRHKNQSIRFNLGRNYFDGWSPNDKIKLITASELADTNRFKLWNPKEQYFLKTNYFINNEQFNSRIFLNYFDEKITNLGFPRQPYYESAFDDYYYTKRMDLGSDLKYSFGKNSKLRFLLAYNTYERKKNTFYKDLTTLEKVLVDNTSQQDTIFFNMINNKIVYSYSANKDLNYQFGFNAQKESGTGKRILDSEQTQEDYALFTNIEWHLSDVFRIKSGFRSSYNTTYTSPITKSISLFSIFNDYNLRLSYSEGFRAPSIKELFFEFIDINHNITGNKDLDAESSKSYNFSIIRHKNILDNKVSIELNSFFNDIYNRISLSEKINNPNEYSYFNIGNYNTLGTESILRIINEKIDASFGVINIATKTSETNSGELLSGSILQNINALYFSKDYFTSLLFRFKKLKINTIISYNLIGQKPIFLDTGDDILESYSDSYQLMDISLTKAIFEDKLKLITGVKNLFDVASVRMSSGSSAHSDSRNYQSVNYGKSYFVSLKLSL